MSCFFPKPIFINKKGSKKKNIQITVPCRNCIGCYLDYSNEWTLRCKMELENYDKSCFITLTYNKECLPDKGQLKRKDFQDFLKRLRRKIEPIKIRFFGCGEYGSKGKRPHGHLIIFGWQPDDLIFFKITKRGETIYRSPTLEKLWNKGFVSVGYASAESIKYCAKYLQKYALSYDKFEVKPFTMCSTRVPIGYNSLDYKSIEADKIYLKGRAYKLPRAFLNRIEKESLFNIEVIKDKREARRIHYEKYYKRTFEENKFLEKKLRETIDFYSRM